MKTVYRRIMTNHKLMGKWTTEHTQVFLDLKMAMISEPGHNRWLPRCIWGDTYTKV